MADDQAGVRLDVQLRVHAQIDELRERSAKDRSTVDGLAHMHVLGADGHPDSLAAASRTRDDHALRLAEVRHGVLTDHLVDG